jgi:hypothetical protein
MTVSDEVREESRRVRALARAADLTGYLILQEETSYEDCLRLLEALRRFALGCFPGKEETFDLIYKPRIERLIQERFP